MTQVRVRYFAGAKAAAGRESEQVELTPGVTTLADLRELLGRRQGFEAVCLASSFLVDGAQADPEADLSDGAVVDVLPPFAGG